MIGRYSPSHHMWIIHARDLLRTAVRERDDALDRLLRMLPSADLDQHYRDRNEDVREVVQLLDAILARCE